MSRSKKEIDQEIAALRALKPVGPFKKKTQRSIALAIGELEDGIDQTSEEWEQMTDSERDIVNTAAMWRDGDTGDKPSEGWGKLVETPKRAPKAKKKPITLAAKATCKIAPCVFLAALLCLFGCEAKAQTIKLAWDPFTAPGVTNFTLYAATNAFAGFAPTNPLVRLNVGTNQSVTIDQLRPGKWWFAVAPNKDGVEWGISPVVAVEAVVPPPNMRVVVIPYALDLTNFYALGFFRLSTP